jgi:hypothetical protein
MKHALFVVFTLATSLAGCESPNDPGVGGVTRAEAEQLNQIAEELNPDAPPPRLTNQQAPTPVPAE